MSLFVVDASVGIKWMLPEPHSAEALRLHAPTHQLHGPAFFTIELANILWKKIR
jgi:predicted nucleic acid-binding protein